jgi:hypothetical protein
VPELQKFRFSRKLEATLTRFQKQLIEIMKYAYLKDMSDMGFPVRTEEESPSAIL